jgi:hypothetical protein
MTLSQDALDSWLSAETAEREAKSRYGAMNFTCWEAFVAGASWQREQSTGYRWSYWTKDKDGNFIEVREQPALSESEREDESEAEVLIPLSDARDLDDVIQALGIADSFTTPAEAVRELQEKIAALEQAAPFPITEPAEKE